jgi:hypothetical protein
MKRILTKLAQSWFRRSQMARKPAPAKKHNIRLSVEALEDRCMPAILAVTSPVDGLTSGTLRTAIAQAGFDADNGISDTIVFAPSLNGSTLTLTQGELILSGNSFTTLTIDGGSQIAISGNNASRVFEVPFGVTAVLTGLTITGGQDTGGSGILNQGNLTVNNCTIVGNSNPNFNGGGILSMAATLTVDHCTIAGNTAFNGGAIDSEDGTTTVSNSTISANNAVNFDGAISNSFGVLIVTDSTLSGNSAGSAGAIGNTGVLTVSRSTLVGNSAQVFGGGIENAGGTALVTNSTLSGNRAGPQGGAVANLAGILTVSYATLSGNSAATGGGIFTTADGSVKLLSTIVAGNTAGSAPDLFGAATGTSNLIGDGSGMTGLANADSNGNRVGTSTSPIDPMLAPLGNYGGPTQTMAPLPGSPVVDAGGPLTTVQSALTAGATTIAVADVTFANTRGPLGALGTIPTTIPVTSVIQIGSEQVLVTNVDAATNTLTVQRGVNGTTAAPHNAGDGVFFSTDQSGHLRVVAGKTSMGAYQPHAFLAGGRLVLHGSRITVQSAGGFVQVQADGQVDEFQTAAVGAIVVNTLAQAGPNTVDLISTPAGIPVTVNVGGNQDVVNVGSATQSLSNIGGAVTLNGNGSTIVQVNDQAQSDPGLYTVTSSTISRAGVALTYQGVAALTLNSGSATGPAYSFLNVSSTAACTATTINAGIRYIVQVGGGANRLDGVLGPVSVNGTGVNGLNIVDSNGTTGYVYTLSYDAASGRSTVARAGRPTIDFAHISGPAVQVLAGLGDDTFNIEGSDPNTNVLEIWGGGGNNSFNLSPTAHNLAGVRGAIAIEGTGPSATGGSAVLTINDQADTLDRGWRLTHGGVALPTVVGIGYDAVNQVIVNAGSGNNSFSVEGLTATIPVTLNAGSGTTAVNVGAPGNTLDPLAGSLIVHGAGVTNVTFNNQGASPTIGHGDFWSAGHVDLYNAQALHVDFTGVAQMTLSDPALTTNMHTFYAMPAVGGLTINGAGNDILEAVAPAVGQNDWWITGANTGNLNHIVNFNNVYFLETAYSGTDVFHLLAGASETAIGNPGLGDTAILDLSGYTPGAVVQLPTSTTWGSVGATGFNGMKQVIGAAGDTLVGPDTATTWSLSGPNAGRVLGAAYYAHVFVADVAFSGFANLKGGSGANTFQFHTGASLSGTLNSGGGSNTLDYSAYTGDVTVNLALGTATGVAGGVSGFANVIGSIGNDLLVGDATASVLRGGTGRNVIIGGAGGGQIFGGGGDNLLIGGTTNYDTNVAALNLIVQEWDRPDVTFAARVSELRGGKLLLNGTPIVLNQTTVHAGLAPDTLTAGAGTNWFFVSNIDPAVVNPGPNDRITRI